MKKFLDFIKDTPTAFHACRKIKNILLDNGFVELNEGEDFNIKLDGKYFITRNSSSILAFCLPSKLDKISYNITAAHLDSPNFKLKPNFNLSKGKYFELNTEVYGGPIYNTWMDRPLNIAGRVIVKTDNGLEEKLISFDKAMAMIPNCSIHYYHELNKGVALNPQSDLLPIFTDSNANLYSLIAEKLDIKESDIVSHDLYLALLDRGTLVGGNDEFIMAPQIDNLECSFGLLESLINTTPKNNSINVMALFDNEEVGSRTRQGAGSKLLSDILERISLTLNFSYLDHKKFLANSFIVSADNAQGFHPNYAFKYDPLNVAYLNEGIVIKNAARGSYTTDAMSLAYFESLCDKCNARYQENTNRSDIAGGSTLGAISLMNVSIPSVDIGLPQIAMHSAYETAGTKDLEDLIKAISKFYITHLDIIADGKFKF